MVSTLAKTLTRTALLSWIVFTTIELAVPTLVTRSFSPHWFLAAFLIGAIWWHLALTKR